MDETHFSYDAGVRITEIDIRRLNKEEDSLDIYIHDLYPVPEKFQTRPDGTPYNLRRLADSINFSVHQMLPARSSAGFSLVVENGEIVAQLHVYSEPFLKWSDYNTEEHRAKLAKALYETFHEFAICFI